MDHLLIESILIGLAGWRIANLLVNENGPFAVFEHLRLFIGLKPGEVSGFLPELFSCVYCMSVWATIAAYFVYLISPIVVMIVAAMSVALIANRIVSSDG